MYAAKRKVFSGPRSSSTPYGDGREQPHVATESKFRESIYLVARQERDRATIAQSFAGLSARFRTFGSLNAYIEHGRTDEPSCLIVELECDERKGENLPARLGGQACPPVILLSEHFDVSVTVRAMRSGVLELLVKPVEVSSLLDAVATALRIDEQRSARRAERLRLERRYALLTPRERQVLPLIVGGLLNKQAASVLGISEVTLQIHRSQIMRKMEARTFADLIRMALKLHIPHHATDGWIRDLRGRVVSLIPEHSHQAEVARDTCAAIA